MTSGVDKRRFEDISPVANSQNTVLILTTTEQHSLSQKVGCTTCASNLQMTQALVSATCRSFYVSDSNHKDKIKSS